MFALTGFIISMYLFVTFQCIFFAFATFWLGCFFNIYFYFLESSSNVSFPSIWLLNNFWAGLCLNKVFVESSAIDSVLNVFINSVSSFCCYVWKTVCHICWCPNCDIEYLCIEYLLLRTVLAMFVLLFFLHYSKYINSLIGQKSITTSPLLFIC